MIPKIIHYCWFGRNPKTPAMEKCIESWKKYCPDYEIIEWNEDNFDIDCIPFVKEAYDNKKWAFVTDYARLKIVYENGGIYLDTDVELIKSIDEFLLLHGFMGFHGTEYINTGVGFGAEKGHPMIYEIMCDYHNRSFPIDMAELKKIACPIINTEIFDRYGFVRNGEKQEVNGITVFPRDYFDPKDSETFELNVTENTYSIHHYDATWKKSKIIPREKIIKLCVKLIGRNNFLKLKKIIKRQ